MKLLQKMFDKLGSILVIIFCLLLCLKGQEAALNSSSLLLVQVLFRHGDRTPTETYPNDPYLNDSYWSEGWGELTNTGKLELYELGRFLRSHYTDFLSDTYSPDDLYVLSSYRDRCLMSAACCLAGLYPPQGDQVWKADINWQPIPIHSIPRNLDKTILVTKPCPAYDMELENAYKSPEYQEIDNQNKDLYEYLTLHTGENISDVTDVEFLYNTLEIEDLKNLTLPEWTSTVYPERMKPLAALSLAIFTYTEAMKRIKGGPLVGQFLEHTSQKVSGTLSPDRKLFMYSAHDITIVNIMRTMGFTELMKPEYGAMLMVELHHTEEEGHLVQLMYRNNTRTDSGLVTLQLPGCSAPCPVDKFNQLLQTVVPDDWESECEIPSPCSS